MRGQPDQGSIKFEAVVEPYKGGFRGRLSIPQDGTRYTEPVSLKEQAAADLNALQRRVLPDVGLGNGFSDALQAEVNARLAAL